VTLSQMPARAATDGEQINAAKAAATSYIGRSRSPPAFRCRSRG